MAGACAVKAGKGTSMQQCSLCAFSDIYRSHRTAAALACAYATHQHIPSWHLACNAVTGATWVARLCSKPAKHVCAVLVALCRLAGGVLQEEAVHLPAPGILAALGLVLAAHHWLDDTPTSPAVPLCQTQLLPQPPLLLLAPKGFRTQQQQQCLHWLAALHKRLRRQQHQQRRLRQQQQQWRQPRWQQQWHLAQRVTWRSRMSSVPFQDCQ